jgi:hypothetical protein
MENYNSATAIKRNGSIIAALSDFPNGVMDAKKRTPLLPISSDEINPKVLVQREAGDQINLYALCTLVSKSAKRIKANAEKRGLFMPMTFVTRAVLHSYRIAAKDKDGPLSTSPPDMKELGELNGRILANLLKQKGSMIQTSRDHS